MDKKVVSILVVGVILIGGLLYFGKNDATDSRVMNNEGLQEYGDAANGFSFNYPKDWILTQTSESTLYLTTAPENSEEGEVTSGRVYRMDVATVRNSERLSARDFVLDLINHPGRDSQEEIVHPLTFEKEFPLEITGLDAYELYGVFSGDAEVEIVYIANDNVVYILSFPIGEANPNYSDPVSNNAVAHKIIESFKFTDSNQTAEESASYSTDANDSVVFKNEIGGYSFVVPSGWSASLNSFDKKFSLFGENASQTEGSGGVEVYPGMIEEVFLSSAFAEPEYGARKKIIVDGLAGTETLYTSSSGKGHSVSFERDGNLYNIYIDSGTKQDIDNFYKIVSSFKFTN